MDLLTFKGKYGKEISVRIHKENTYTSNEDNSVKLSVSLSLLKWGLL